MKNLFKYAVCLFAVAAGAVSCNHETGDDDANVNYPQTLTLGNWVSESTSDLTSTYVVGLSIGAKGDTVCTLVKKNNETGVYNSATSTNCTYNPKTGMVSVELDKSPEPAAGRPAGEVYIAWQRTFDSMTVRYRTYTTNRNGKSYTERATFRGLPCAGVPVNGSELYSADETWGVSFNSRDNLCGFMMGEESGDGIYEFDYSTGKGTITVINNTKDQTPTGKVLTLSVNSLNQLVMSDGQASKELFR
jgi:hypothetical protein